MSRFAALLFLFPVPVLAAEQVVHTDPIAPVILGVTWILSMAIVGRFVARRFHQPAVVGELLMGIVLGHVGYLAGGDMVTLLREVPQVFDLMSGMGTAATFDGETAAALNRVLNQPDGGVMLQVAHSVDVFSRYGVIFLLFLVGLESSGEEMRHVGAESARVAVIGVVAPFLLGVLTIQLLTPDLSANTQMFVAATLGATSVGITARVLRELNKEKSREGHIILGAAVMDDILGLIVLAVVSGIVVSGEFALGQVVWHIFLSLAFLGGAIALGPHVLKYAIRFLGRLDLVEAKMFTSFLFVMILAWIANLAGLATIVGAFTAGLILHDSYFHDVFDPEKHVTIRDLIQPLEVVFVPIFFVLMGIQVKLEKLADPQILLLGGGLIIAAIIGKIVAGIGAGKGARRLAIGFGMMPRGEVGLIFASIGKVLGVMSDTLFSAIVIMVIVTTLLAPGLLKWSMNRPAGGSGNAAAK
ncbi:MAG: cation:proton antiporter [Chromatiales bacterium]|nr:MAG: cation:proton antiporter [Chromatiales bacterium]